MLILKLCQPLLLQFLIRGFRVIIACTLNDGKAFRFEMFFPMHVMAVPNVVLFLTDDQDVMLGGMTPMIRTQFWIGGENGVTFENAFATTPVCCPSRSSILTGLYQRNHGVLNNSLSGGCSSPAWRGNHEKRTIGSILHKEGYRTFYAGKYLNQYGLHRSSLKSPPGWDWWIGLIGNSVYYNYSLSINGTKKEYGGNSVDYLTDVIRDWSLEFLRHQRKKTPFLMVIGVPAPHEPFTPAVKYDGAYRGRKAPRTPNFNTGTKNKHWLVRSGQGVLSEEAIAEVDEAFRKRWETLLSVDEMVDMIMTSLKYQGLLDNTAVIFTSDHGFHLGQFAQAWDKRQPYETDIRIPFLFRSPGLTRNITVPYPVLTIDIAPTIYELAGVKKAPNTDGKSILQDILHVTQTFKRTFKVEYHGEGGSGAPCFSDNNVKLCSTAFGCKCFDSRNNTYKCNRRLSNYRNTINCSFNDEENYVEAFNINKDPYQMNNLAKLNS